MASVLPDIEDRIVALLQGSQSGITRSITAGRFKHVQFDPAQALSAAAQKPYKFELEDNGEYQPSDVPSTISPSYVWHAVEIILRVAYMSAAHRRLDRQKEIQKDRYRIRRCLGDPDSFSGVEGFSKLTADTGTITAVQAPGSEGSEMDPVILLLEVPLQIVYREDHTS